MGPALVVKQVPTGERFEGMRSGLAVQSLDYRNKSSLVPARPFRPLDYKDFDRTLRSL